MGGRQTLSSARLNVFDEAAWLTANYGHGGVKTASYVAPLGLRSVPTADFDPPIEIRNAEESAAGQTPK